MGFERQNKPILIVMMFCSGFKGLGDSVTEVSSFLCHLRLTLLCDCGWY